MGRHKRTVPPPWEHGYLVKAMRRYLREFMDLNDLSYSDFPGTTRQEARAVVAGSTGNVGLKRLVDLANALGLRPSELLRRMEERY